MNRVGEVVRAAQGLAVIRCASESHPGLGAPLVDEQLTTLGAVVDIFGPVDRPYVAVAPTDSDPAAALGRTVYSKPDLADG
jgi:RNA-binding protein involved in rRNA processing